MKAKFVVYSSHGKLMCDSPFNTFAQADNYAAMLRIDFADDVDTYFFVEQV